VVAVGRELAAVLAAVVPEFKDGKTARLRTALRAVSVYLLRLSKRATPTPVRLLIHGVGLMLTAGRQATSAMDAKAVEAALRPLLETGAVASPVVRTEVVRILKLLGIECVSSSCRERQREREKEC
jgi:hypothetical protein